MSHTVGGWLDVPCSTVLRRILSKRCVTIRPASAAPRLTLRAVVRFSIGLPRAAHLQPWLGSMVEIARTIEDAGLDACYVTDHPFPVVAGNDAAHHALDPFVLLGSIASVTRTLLLHLNAVVLPYRNPFLTAKAVATLDQMSGGRVLLGVAAGYLREEFAALGVDYAARNELVEEAITAIKAAWTGKAVALIGRGWHSSGNVSLPSPVRSPHPPIWMGGNSARAMERAVALCDGWSPVESSRRHAADIHTADIADLSALRRKLALLPQMIQRAGRELPFDVCYVRRDMSWLTGSDEDALQEIDTMREIGLSWCAIRFAAESMPELVERIQAFGEPVARSRRTSSPN